MNKGKAFEKEFEEVVISLQKFLTSYCYLDIKNKEKFNVTHKDIMYLFPDFKRVSFDELYSKKEKIYTGEIILVKDYKNNLAPYINPNYINEDVMEYNYTIDSKKRFIIRSNITNNELKYICSKLRKNKLTKEYRLAHKMLLSKSNKRVKQYKKLKNNLKFERGYEND